MPGRLKYSKQHVLNSWRPQNQKRQFGVEAQFPTSLRMPAPASYFSNDFQQPLISREAIAPRLADHQVQKQQ